MVAIIFSAQFLNHLFPGISQLLSHIINIARHLRQHLLLRNTTDGSIRIIHTDILDIVQLTKDTELRELGDARQEDEAQVGIAGLQWRVEVAHRVAQALQFPLLVHHVEQRCVILIDQDHHLLAGLPIGTLDQAPQALIRIDIIRRPFAIDRLVGGQLAAQLQVQVLLLHVLGGTHVEPQHRVLRPLLLQLLDGQSLEQLPPPFEVGSQGGEQQRLAKPTGTAQEN